MKGHRSSSCPLKRVHFTAVEDEVIYFTSVSGNDHQCSNNQSNEDGLTSIFLIDTAEEHDTTILLDTQASAHIFCSIEAVSDIRNADKPVTVQGITGDRVKVTMEGDIKEIGLRGYFSQSMSANIISYSKLKETHDIRYDKDTDMFTAIPTEGPTLTFSCVQGHYTMNLATVVHTYVTTIDTKVLRNSAKQLAGARRAYEFMQRMGYVSYKAAAEIIQRGSMTNLPCTRADLVIAQDIYGTPAANQLGQGVQQTVKMRESDRIPLHQSVKQELQVDLFYFLGQTFFLSISVILGLIMVTHLGPGTEKVVTTSRTTEGSRSKAGQALILHIQQYLAKGFQINLITSDGEGAVKTVRRDIENLGADLNILGHGSHAPHAEAAIRHIKNKARSTLHSLPFPLPTKLAAALVAFVVNIFNMVPKLNSPGHLPAYTAFRGRVPNYILDAPFSFETAGFLQKAQGPMSSSAAPRADYCLWLGTTRNQKGTHRCLNLSMLQEITGDTFRPAPLTEDTLRQLKQLATPGAVLPPVMLEQLLDDPNAPYHLDPTRGVDLEAPPTELTEATADVIVSLTPAEVPLDDLEREETDITQEDITMNGPPILEEGIQDTSVPEEGVQDTSIPEEGVQESNEVEVSAHKLLSNRANPGYNLRSSTLDKHVFAALSIKEANSLYGAEVTDAAIVEELMNCIQKEIFEFQLPDYTAKSIIPSKMFLTPKKLPNGNIDRMKERLVAGGHRQDRSLYTDVETSSPTAALSSVMMAAALAAH